MEKQFGKGDLKSGYVVKIGVGELLFVVRHNQTKFRKILINVKGEYLDLASYNSDLIYKDGSHKRCDIVEVYGLSERASYALSTNIEYRPLLWKRIEEVEMTMDEICKELGKQVKIVEKH